jgi:hypothetical protein
VLKLEEDWLLRGCVGLVLLAAKLQDVTPKMALAVDLDVFHPGHE